MSDIDRIKNCWTMPDNWSIQMTDDKMEVFDNDNEPVATAITQIRLIERINEHLKIQESWIAYKLMEATLKEPIEA